MTKITLKYKHLIGRPFVYGSTDCYGLARDFYKDNFEIALTDYARADGWCVAGQNLLLDHFTDEGFFTVDEHIRKIRPGDGLLVALASVVPNHIGIYLGDNTILHHRQGQLSAVTTHSGFFRSRVCAHLRHKDVMLPPEQGSIELMDLIAPHKRLEIEAALKARAASSETTVLPAEQSG